ncbi:MAG: 30S ribosomal protein S19e [Candidatus Methanoperedens sp.]|nr:30S ribosomal protein S19e [Candidatus Methanoperedens sp.]MCE8425899.1 30S ribosomal protein S19e [Candidatus Methanoperedens sp.]MCE8427388.1 30S ribosomal protein S19e [Candidatus Methanoperedens sp.]
MTTIYDVPADLLINNVAQKLKTEEKAKPPEWANFAKTGAHKELAPDNADWWYVRCASILRRVYIDGPVGISRLRSFYGGRHRNGVTGIHFSKGSGSIAREALQQLEKAGFIKTQKIGRTLSPQGQSFLNNAANEVKTELIKTNPALAKY